MGGRPLAEETESYEREVMEALLRSFGGTTSDVMLGSGRIFRGVALSGRHPNTTVRVFYQNRRSGEDEVWEVRLWDFARESGGHLTEPGGLATIIAVNLMEP
jgi:hypothetical protein